MKIYTWITHLTTRYTFEAMYLVISKIQFHMITLMTDVLAVFPGVCFISLAFVEVPSLNVNRNVIKTMDVKAMLH